MMPPLVDVTLLSLAGLSLSCQSKTVQNEHSPSTKGFAITASEIPKLTAAVSFSGSAANMQVASSFICARTGNLMVESDDAVLVPAQSTLSETSSALLQQSSQSPVPEHPTNLPLVAQWRNSTDSNDFNGGFGDQQPHVSIRLPPQDPRLPAMSVSCTNRDSKIIVSTSTSSSNDQQQPSLHGSDVSSQESFEEHEHGGASVFWSQSGAGGAVMPEIVELTVFLKVDPESWKSKRPNQQSHSSRLLVGGGTINETPSLLDATDSWDEIEDFHSESVYEVGIAYLVLFGNDGGTTVMDLPIKQLRSNFPDYIHVDPTTASLRIRVNVYPSGKKASRRSSRNPALAMGLLRQAYDLHDRNVLEPILRQLKVSEEMNTCKQAEPKKGNDENAVPGHGDPPTQAAMLCGLSNAYDFINSVRCDDGADGIMPRRVDSMDSTINTAPSMTFW